MFLNDADRLAFIKGLGGQLVRHQGGEFWAVFRLEPVLAFDGSVESTKPTIEFRATDGIRIDKDTAVTIGGDSYRVSRIETDDSGFSTAILKR